MKTLKHLVQFIIMIFVFCSSSLAQQDWLLDTMPPNLET
jgi:hypothetical protein